MVKKQDKIAIQRTIMKNHLCDKVDTKDFAIADYSSTCDHIKKILDDLWYANVEILNNVLDFPVFKCKACKVITPYSGLMLSWK